MISKDQNKILKNIIKKYKLDLVVLFGSRSKKQEREDSDYDIAIYSKNKISSKKFWNIWSDLECIFLPKIDLVNINEDIDPLLANNIFRNGVCLFESEKMLFDEMQTNAIYNYIDYSALYEIEKEIVQNKLNTI